MTILNIYNSYYKHIPLGVFNTAVAADPTSYNQDKIVKVGNFVKWILKLYTNGSWKPGDSYETMDLLTKFIRLKSKLPIDKRDINRFNSIHELYSLIQTLEEQGVKTQSEVKREGAEVVYEDSEWKIVIPYTKEASCIYGAHTKWCTAGRGNNMFKYYNEKGPLYININKVTGDKYQFHFETGSFMDAEDKKISPKKIGLSEGAVEYYKSIGKELYFIYDEVGGFFNGFAKVQIEGRGWNFIKTNGELLWKGNEWFDNVWNFQNRLAKVQIEGRGYNWINTNGELLWKEDEWFDKVYDFSEVFAVVKIEGKGYNFINQRGELLWKGDKWFDNAWSFTNGFARVKLEGRRWNFIQTNGEFLWKEDLWFDKICDFDNGFAPVQIEGKGWNLINEQGELLWKDFKFFNYVNYFSEGFAWVQLEEKGYNYINEQGELVWKGEKWFDGVNSFSNGFAIVRLEGKFNYINEQGELVWKEDKWFDGVGVFKNGFAGVRLEGRGWNFINPQGELLWKEDKWFDGVSYFSDGLAEVKYNNNLYKLNTKGELIEN